MTGGPETEVSKVALEPNELKTAMGTKSIVLQYDLVNQIANTLRYPANASSADQHTKVKAALAVLKGIKPSDELEGLLAAQMVATHEAAMECLRRAMIAEQTFDGRDQNLKHAAKLLGLYARQMETLDKHRGKGRQKITVEHVNVEPGGQAIVGSVELGSKEAAAAKGQAQLAHSDDPMMPQINEQSASEKSPARRKEKKRDE